MAELSATGAVGFTDDGKPVASAGMLRKALQYQRLCGGVLALHEEDPTLSRGGAMNEGPVSAALGIAGIPSVAESTMVARDAALAADEDARVHFMHLSCAGSVRAVAAAKREGARVSAEVSPHHLLLTDEDVRTLDTRMKMHPPLTSEADRLALVEGLRDGTIDCVATDHAPHAREEKEVPFEQAPMGTTGLETAFAALHTGLVVPGVIGLALLVERLTAGAALFGLPLARIAPGRAREPRARRPRRALDGGRARLGEPLGELLLRRPRAAGSRAAHARSRGRRPPRPRARAGGGLMGLLSRQRTTLIVVDVQEGFRSYETFETVASQCAKLLEAARILGVPALVSEQYPKGLGHTVAEVGVRDEPVIEKTVFSAAKADGFRLAGRDQAVVCGIETHVCVSQTAHDLLSRGVEVHIPADAVGSRHRLDYDRGLDRLDRAGAVVSTVETVLFELLGRAGTPEFKEVQALVK